VTSHGVLIAGAGIGGLTAALAVARLGHRVTLFDQMAKLEEVGAGIQLAPNATRILVALGLAERLETTIVQPCAIRLRSGPSGREIATMRLDAAALHRYGAPYWVIHRADLQKALIEAIADEPQITLMLGATVADFMIDPIGVRATVRRGGAGRAEAEDYSGAALIGADGLWSRVRALLGDSTAPRFGGRGAFRALIPACQLSPQNREPIINVWIGPDGHLVHYPVRAGAAVNVVAVCGDRWQSQAWNAGAGRDEVLERFPAAAWAPAARELLATAERWQKWALYDRKPSAWGRGPVTLLGDAAHPMLPFLAQGAAMAIEDASILGRELARSPGDPIAALRDYEAARRARTARVQRASRRNDFHFHLPQPAAFVRDAGLRALGGKRLLAHYDWVYQWRP
jgi:salicylate hydroxylase